MHDNATIGYMHITSLVNEVYIIILIFRKNLLKTTAASHLKMSCPLTVNLKEIVLNHELYSQQRLTIGNFPYI